MRVVARRAQRHGISLGLTTSNSGQLSHDTSMASPPCCCGRSQPAFCMNCRWDHRHHGGSLYWWRYQNHIRWGSSASDQHCFTSSSQSPILTRKMAADGQGRPLCWKKDASPLPQVSTDITRNDDQRGHMTLTRQRFVLSGLKPPR